jgi:catechol 2,3-dioxygenase-like lactoylglutathione lyase family enzyme
MIKGLHAMFYSSEPEATRAFFRDKLGFKARDVGEGWLIFDMPAADLGFHPAETEEGGTSGSPSISFYCDDINKTVADLKASGVEFAEPVVDRGFGLVTHFKVPGNFKIMLYQPRY